LTGPIKRRQNLHQQLQENEQHIHDLQDQIITTQKLSTLGTMACLIAHEFNNILTPMINYAQLALENDDDIDLMRKALNKTIRHGNRAALIIQSMLGLVRDQTKNREQVKLAHVIEESFQCLARDFDKDRIKVVIDVPENLTVSAVPGQLQQVLLNLIINARQAMLVSGGTLTIKAAPADDKNVHIQVSDSGSGIEPEIVDKIFEPFFSTKLQAKLPDQQGTGLGLSVCKSIIEAHGGTISVQSRPPQGTSFVISLPA
jgi:signal transduction histidine kinase